MALEKSDKEFLTKLIKDVLKSNSSNKSNKKEFDANVENRNNREFKKQISEKQNEEFFKGFQEIYNKHMAKIAEIEAKKNEAESKGHKTTVEQQQKLLEKESSALADVVKHYYTLSNTFEVITDAQKEQARLQAQREQEINRKYDILLSNPMLSDKERKEYERQRQRELVGKDPKKTEQKENLENLGSQITDSLSEEFDDLFKPSGDFGNMLTKSFGDSLGPTGKIIGAAIKVLESINSTMAKGFEQALSLQQNYMAGINARLNGLSEQANVYETLMNNMSNFAGSQYVSMKKLTENVSKLTESGIAYNLEERALLETIKDRMVTTFSAVEGQLDRLILLQQSDITRQQMGAEYQLNKMLNSMFKDTSYLSSMYDTVSSALIDVTGGGTGVNSRQAVEINFAAQKWLGALFSSGMSANAVGALAQGLANLATGNIEALNGTPIGNLFALSARNAGASYTDILSNGLNASNINDLMQAIVTYLAQVAENTSNNVAKTAMFGAVGGNFTYSDIRAITNLATNSTLMNEISSYNPSYTETSSLFTEALSGVKDRTSVVDRVNNLIDNAVLNLGLNMLSKNSTLRARGFVDEYGNSMAMPVSTGDSQLVDYALYSLTKMLPEGVVKKLAQGVWSLGHIDDLFESGAETFRSLVNDSENPLNNFNVYLNKSWRASNVRGEAYIPTALAGALSTGVSYSNYIGSSAAERSAYNLYQQANSPTLSTQAIIEGNTSGTMRDISDLYAELFEYQTKPIRVAIAQFESGALNDIGAGANGILVDIQDNDVNSLLNQVYTIRSTR